MPNTMSSDSLSRERRLTDAYCVGIDLRDTLRGGTGLLDALSAVEEKFDTLTDSYPDWHPAPYSFDGMIRLFLYHEFTGASYRQLETYPELATAIGLTKTPDESVLSRTWRNRFTDGVREYGHPVGIHRCRDVLNLDKTIRFVGMATKPKIGTHRRVWDINLGLHTGIPGQPRHQPPFKRLTH